MGGSSNSGFRTGEIQDWRDSGLRDLGLEIFRTGGIYDCRDSGLARLRKSGIQEKRDIGKEGFRT